MKLNNKGTTLVEITAGFLMLIVIMTSFIKIINLSSEMTNTATDMKTKNLEFEKAFRNGVNYKVTGGSYNGQYAFREYDSMILKRKVNDNSEDYQIISVELTECQKDSSGSFLKNPSATPITLSDVHIFRIENLKDTSMSRISVFRYARNYTKPIP